MINGRLPKRINNKLALKGDGSNKWIRLSDSYPHSLTNFSFCYLELRDSSSQVDKCSFELRKDANNFIQIRSGNAGSRDAYTYQLNFAGTTISALAQSPEFAEDQNQNVGNKVSLISCSVDQANNTFRMYKNGGLYRSVTDAAITGVDFTASLLALMARHGGLIPINAAFNNCALFNKVLTPEEHKLLAHSLGYIPKSLHVNVLNHWPLTQKYYYDDSGTLKAWDTVEQYNYSKVSALSPIHATLENFTASEVGANEPANQSQIFDTNSKQLSNNWGLYFNGIDQYAQQSPLTNNIVTADRDDITLYVRLNKIQDTGTTVIPVLFRNGSTTSLNVQFNVSINNIELAAELDGSTGKAVFSNTVWNRPLNIICEKLNENPANWKLSINGVSKTLTGTVGTQGATTANFTFNQLTLGGALSGASNFDYKGVIEQVALWDRLLTVEEKRNIYLKNVIPSSGLLENVYIEKRSDNQINTFAGNTLTLQNFTLANFDSYYREKESGLPEIKNALRFVKASSHRLIQNTINITPNADFYTFMIIAKAPDSAPDWGTNFDGLMVYGLQSASNRFYFGGRSPQGYQFAQVSGGVGKSSLALTEYSPANDLQVIFYETDQVLAQQGTSLSDTFYLNGNKILTNGSGNISKLDFDLYTSIEFGNNPFSTSQSYNGFIAAYGLWSRKLTNREKVYLTNNLLFKTPKGSIKNNLEQYNNFNMQTANGIEDLSGKGNHINSFVNYTTNELDPLHPDYKFININTLR